MCVGSSFWNCYLLQLMTLAHVLMNHQTGASKLFMMTEHKLPANCHVYMAHASPLSQIWWEQCWNGQ